MICLGKIKDEKNNTGIKPEGENEYVHECRYCRMNKFCSSPLLHFFRHDQRLSYQ